MENAVEALEMAFAIFVFIIAITVALFTFGRVKAAYDQLALMSDQDYMEPVTRLGYREEDLNSENRQTRVARRVKAKDIIPLLYSFSTETQCIIIDLDPNNVMAYELRGPEQGKFVFGLGPLGAFNRMPSGTRENGTLTYTIFDWAAAQQGTPDGIINTLTIRDYVDAFVSGKRLSYTNGGIEYGVKKQTIEETITTSTITDAVTGRNIVIQNITKQTTAIENDYILDFSGGLPYLMQIADREFIETYETVSIPNNAREPGGLMRLLKIRSEDDESEEKEYVYITYTLIIP